jgi:receptor protein-tyrosine kinase
LEINEGAAMSLIEKAVERLDQLNKASQEPGAAPVAPPRAERVATPARVSEPPVEAGEPVSRAVQIDLARLNDMGMVTPDHPRSAIAEEYRVIKRPLLKNASSRSASRVDDGNLIMVTSALPGEGKSFTALNLAISMAMELDHTVLLVDADVSKPSVLRTLGLPPERGLMDVLVDASVDLPDVLLRTNIEKLSILPAGNTSQRATELLASEGMNRLLDEMASRYSDRIIVFDSPPLLVTTEARALATHMGQIVLVVEAERTTHTAVKQALATIEACPMKMMLLNKSTMQGAGGYYGYGYGYGYGHEEGAQDARAA